MRGRDITPVAACGILGSFGNKAASLLLDGVGRNTIASGSSVAMKHVTAGAANGRASHGIRKGNSGT